MRRVGARAFGWVVALALVAACGEEPGTEAGGADSGTPSDVAGGDAGSVDAAPVADVASTDVPLTDAAGDAAHPVPDAAGPGDGETPDSGDSGAADAQDVAAPPDLPHYALSLLHFNIQYVAGGSEGIIASLGGLLTRPEGFSELDEQEMEDQIIVESYRPVLDLLAAHPTWTLSIEMQGYMLEVIMERHPETFALTKALVEAGQVDLVSFHYSDQLFIAGHRESMERSLAMNEAVFEKAGIQRSRAIFTQEGQFGEGMAPLMAEYGYDLALLPKNLWSYQHGDGPVAPMYAMGGRHVVISGRSTEDPATGLRSMWTFVDDGELLMTNDLDPYLSSLFVFHQPSYDKFEKKLLDLEAQGWKIASLGAWRQAVLDAGIDVPELPPVLDGCWQPKDTQNVYRWMGGAGVWGASERDNEVLRANVRARHALLAAEVAGANAGAAPPTELLAQGWRELLLGEVSDATGWNPWNGEVQYSLTHSAAALAIAEQIIAAGLPPGQQVDLATGLVEPLTVEEAPGADVDPLFGIEGEGKGWAVTEQWQEAPDGAWLTVTFTPEIADPGRDVKVVMPFTHDHVVTSPALLESEVRSYPLDAFTWSTIGIPLANGLLGLGPDRFLIKDMRTLHLAAVLDRGAQTVTFRDETSPTSVPVSWRFLILEGVTAEQARQRADRLNVHPVWRPASAP